MIFSKEFIKDLNDYCLDHLEHFECFPVEFEWLGEVYKFEEEEIEHFWLHSEVDIEHGERGFEALLKHCSPREMQDMAVQYARESAYMRWFYFDGIFLLYEQSYDLK